MIKLKDLLFEAVIHIRYYEDLAKAKRLLAQADIDYVAWAILRQSYIRISDKNKQKALSVLKKSHIPMKYGDKKFNWK